MPLKIETTDFGAAPVVLCDQCGEPILDARDGNYQWLADNEAGSTRRFVFFTHKSCSHAFEQHRGGAEAWYAMELADLLSYLAHAMQPEHHVAPPSADLMGRSG